MRRSFRVFISLFHQNFRKNEKSAEIENKQPISVWAVYYRQLIEALILVLARCFGFLTALDTGALVVLLLSQVGQNAGLCAASLKSFKSVVQRLVFLDVNFRHLFPSLQTRHAALKGPTIGLLTEAL